METPPPDHLPPPRVRVNQRPLRTLRAAEAVQTLRAPQTQQGGDSVNCEAARELWGRGADTNTRR